MVLAAPRFHWFWIQDWCLSRQSCGHLLGLKRVVPPLHMMGELCFCAAGRWFGNANLQHAVAKVTGDTGGKYISADRARNAASPAFPACSNLAIADPGNERGRIAVRNHVTLILIAPAGSSSGAGEGSVRGLNGGDILPASDIRFRLQAEATTHTSELLIRAQEL
jgi:hypothetical protein